MVVIAMQLMEGGNLRAAMLDEDKQEQLRWEAR